MTRPVAAQIRAGRILAGMSLRELAESANVSGATISKLEQGRTRNPRNVTVHALRDALARKGIEFAPGGWVRIRPDDAGAMLPVAGVDARAQALTLLDLARRLLLDDDVDMSGIRIADGTDGWPPRLRYELPPRRPGRR